MKRGVLKLTHWTRAGNKINIWISPQIWARVSNKEIKGATASAAQTSVPLFSHLGDLSFSPFFSHLGDLSFSPFFLSPRRFVFFFFHLWDLSFSPFFVDENPPPPGFAFFVLYFCWWGFQLFSHLQDLFFPSFEDVHCTFFSSPWDLSFSFLKMRVPFLSPPRFVIFSLLVVNVVLVYEDSFLPFFLFGFEGPCLQN